MNMNLSWLIGGNFNVILSDENKIEGLPVYPQECEDFTFCANSLELLDINFKENPFTGGVVELIVNVFSND